MALAVSLAVLLAVVLFAFVATALGHRLLRLCSFEIPSLSEHLLCSAAFGVICIEDCLFLSLLSGNVRIGVVAVIVVIFLLAFNESKTVSRKLTQVVRSILNESRPGKTLASFAGLVLLIEGLAAMAPLTGSDALHYHFTASLLILRSGFHPNFFLSHSFFCGQSHLLILMGLALGSSQLAMGLMFLGGFLTAAACACLVNRWTSGVWKWIAVLVFLVTPVVFWQISAAGAPDLWMDFLPQPAFWSFHARMNCPALLTQYWLALSQGALLEQSIQGALSRAAWPWHFFGSRDLPSAGFSFFADRWALVFGLTQGILFGPETQCFLF